MAVVICKEHGTHSSGPVERWGAPWCRLERPSGWACEAAERGPPWGAETRSDGGIPRVCRFGSVFQGVPWRRLLPRWEGPRLAVATVNAGVGLDVGGARNHRPCRRLGALLEVREAISLCRSRGHSQETKPKPCRFGRCGSSSDPTWELPQNTASIVGKCSRLFHTRANDVASERCTNATEEFRQNW